MVEQLRQDIRDFKAANNCERVVVLWAASTEIYIPLSDEHMSLAALEKAMKDNNTEVISPSMCYAYAAIAEDAPFVMGAPNLCVDTPAMWEFSKQKECTYFRKRLQERSDTDENSIGTDVQDPYAGCERLVLY